MWTMGTDMLISSLSSAFEPVLFFCRAPLPVLFFSNEMPRNCGADRGRAKIHHGIGASLTPS